MKKGKHHVRKVKHRGKRRSTKKLKNLLIVFGVLCLIVSAGLTALALQIPTPRLRMLRLIYLGAALLQFAVLGILEGLGALRRWTRQEPRAAVEPRKSGIALLLVLLLMTVLTGITLQAQLLTRLALRQAQQKAVRTALHGAAADALWNALQNLANRSAKARAHAGAAFPATLALPSGIETTVALVKTNQAALPALLRSGSRPGLGADALYAGRAVARLDNQSAEIRSLVRCSPQGEVRVVAWLEQR